MSGVERRPTAWAPLTRAEDDAIWDRFYARFAFRPSVHAEHFPSIREPVPSLTFALPRVPGSSPRDGEIGRLMPSTAQLADLHAAMLAAFRSCTARSEQLYVLDWQHQSYRLQPHADVETWPITIHPDVDYHLFLAADLSWGTFGHPWEWTICLFGRPLIDAVLRSPPRLLGIPIRRDGEPLT